MRCVAIRHIECEDLGIFEPLVRAQFELEYIDMPRDGAITPALDKARLADLVVSLGGPMGVYEEDRYPWLTVEIDLLRERITHGRATLGICLGSQLLAAAAGARVYPSGQQEVGWYPIDFTPGAEMDPVLNQLIDGGTAFFHWHGDTFDLPAGGRLIGSSDRCEHQGFRLGKHVIGLQFHAEVDGKILEQWLTAYDGQLPSGDGVMTSEQLRAGAAKYGPGINQRARKFMCAWLEQLFGEGVA